MGLTQVSTDGVKNDAITKTNIPANQIEASELADNAVDTNAIANNAVTAGKLASGVQTTINNNADNRVITGSGTANTLEGEANFTYNSTLAQLTTDTSTNNTELIRLQNSHTDGKMTVMGFNTDGLGSSQTRIYGGNDNTGAASQQGDSGAGKFKVTITNPSGTHQEVIYAENDANTASKFVRLSTNGSERMRIDSSGNVGIGTTSPSAKLQVSGGHINIDSGYSYQWGDSHERIEQSDGKIEFFTNNGEQMTLSGGNLGIGTTAPGESLHVAGNIINTENIASSGDSGIMIGNGHRLGFDQSGTRSWTVKAQDGVLNIASGDGASAPRVAGLLFGSDTAAANTLDDYEEGTFTPTQPSIGTNSAAGTYTKIGRLVTARIFITLPNNSSGQYFVIDGLPFPAINPQSGMDIQGGYVIYSTYGAAVLVRVNAGGTRVVVNGIGGTNIQLTTLDNINFRLQVHYFTA